MNRLTIWVVAAVAAVLALGAGIYFGERQWRGGESVAGESAGTLFALALPDEQGTTQALAQWRGKVLVVNFWATWCAPCREEMPEFVRTQDEFGAKGLQFVGIAVDEQAKVQQFTREIGLNYPALIGGFGAMELSRTLGNRQMALPFTVIVGRNGTVAYAQLGPMKKEQLRQIIGTLL